MMRLRDCYQIDDKQFLGYRYAVSGCCIDCSAQKPALSRRLTPAELNPTLANQPCYEAEKLSALNKSFCIDQQSHGHL